MVIFERNGRLLVEFSLNLQDHINKLALLIPVI